ncbi:hypothetical protein HDV57DRAFT_123424 [Trichoderma longibrachiatum]
MSCWLLAGVWEAASCHVLAAVDTSGGRARHSHPSCDSYSLHFASSASCPPHLWPLCLLSRWGISPLGMGSETMRKVCRCMIGPPLSLGFHWPGCLEPHVSCKKMSAEEGILNGHIRPGGFAFLICCRRHKSRHFADYAFRPKADTGNANDP